MANCGKAGSASIEKRVDIRLQIQHHRRGRAGGLEQSFFDQMLVALDLVAPVFLAVVERIVGPAENFRRAEVGVYARVADRQVTWPTWGNS